MVIVRSADHSGGKQIGAFPPVIGELIINSMYLDLFAKGIDTRICRMQETCRHKSNAFLCRQHTHFNLCYNGNYLRIQI